ncbi:MAG TPA: MBL fold metallo-hydrolase [Puia sp.]|uniref:MBL fold metallo-hydrolase n=1 Tax=Puia sp. TaxID=2045100 RepID=UPI002D1837AC|nr:MBL fold metallo-hydrolase [Puia sp.]HVU98327.1 MBL fold metallo-hydrolase [Puia sp.]
MSLLKSLGKQPAGLRLQRILRSSHYRDGSFQNPIPTEVTLKDTTIWKMLGEYRRRPTDSTPPGPLPSIRTNLTHLPPDKATVVWFGHSSYLLRLGPTHILVDPVFSGNASPFTFFAKAYPGADIYKPADMPPTLEAILLTHDHYDHLDYRTIQQLNPRTRHFYTSLGVGAHLEFWGIPPEKITELDWGETVHIDPTGKPLTATSSVTTGGPVSTSDLIAASPSRAAADDTLHLTATPARHFSGRTFKRGQSAWSSFILNAPDPSSPGKTRLNLFLGGDSGYGPHFQSIGQQYGPFDLAFLECGQYGVHWPHIHMFPEETILAAVDLKAKALLPVHWAKFTLSLHPWNEPIRRVLAEAKAFHVHITTPRIGQPVIINHDYPIDPWYDLNRMESGSKT